MMSNMAFRAVVMHENWTHMAIYSGLAAVGAEAGGGEGGVGGGGKVGAPVRTGC